MKSYSYGFLVMGWMPAEGMMSGGRFVMFRNKAEYEIAFRRQEYEKRVFYVEETKKPSLDELIAAAGISGGKGRYKIRNNRRGR